MNLSQTTNPLLSFFGTVFISHCLGFSLQFKTQGLTEKEKSTKLYNYKGAAPAMLIFRACL